MAGASCASQRPSREGCTGTYPTPLWRLSSARRLRFTDNPQRLVRAAGLTGTTQNIYIPLAEQRIWEGKLINYYDEKNRLTLLRTAVSISIASLLKYAKSIHLSKVFQNP